ncbi:hypothetical protein EXIGLDRAFT_727260 [Exidia glandulosa HHB12029]|uniref:Uncharacterized protein n=1 Tax=Exidia glandulosa HHB12029 TaxID=1314781 RepID=A0A165DES6_EXIGL|nr:hypothetical protein EXIGLDRAFT_727260 [Exidia glandulosa HHB12029]
MRASIAFVFATLASISLAAPSPVAASELLKRDDCWNENFNYGWWTGHAECSGNQMDLANRPLFGTCQWDASTVAFGESVGRTAC